MVDKIANPAAAANAYANMAKVASVNETTVERQESFGAVLKNSILDSISTMKHSETMSARAVTGDASLPDVVQAVNAAELTLQTVTAVRDRLINAYSELMRTQM